MFHLQIVIILSCYFQSFFPLHSFFCLTVLANISSTILNSSYIIVEIGIFAMFFYIRMPLVLFIH